MTETKSRKLSIIILTGLSGAGKTVALNAFEDSGYFCVDNLPSPLINTFANLCSKTPTISKIAIGIDIRERKFLQKFSDMTSSLRKKHALQIIFLEAEEDVLIRRFKETRRPHPLGHNDLKKAIQKEIELLSHIKQESDTIIDSSSLSPHQLRKMILEFYLKKGPQEMTINLISFGYKYGVPLEADLMFDVRFLPNPYFIQELKHLPGTSKEVKDFVLSKNETKEFLEKFYPLLDHVIPLYKQEGKSYLTIAIGCTGGHHRSPAILQEIEKRLKKQKLTTILSHRDLHD